MPTDQSSAIQYASQSSHHGYARLAKGPKEQPESKQSSKRKQEDAFFSVRLLPMLHSCLPRLWVQHPGTTWPASLCLFGVFFLP